MTCEIKSVVLAAALLALGWLPHAHGAFYGVPRWLQPGGDHVAFNAPSLPPLGHTRFCLRYPADCEVRWAPSHLRGLELDKRRWTELILVNHAANSAILPQRNGDGIFGEEWLVMPPAGDCNDYAVTKRHQLIARGWSSQSLLLAEVVTLWGEHHLVLVIRTAQADLVLDNITRRIRPWSDTHYRWIRIQSPSNPKFWWTVDTSGA
jgi:predicted transglutaminase-like cysteine proteinase